MIAGPSGGDHVIDALPRVFVCPPMVLTGATLGVNLILDVGGTAAPGETKVPSFPNTKNVTPILEPMIHTNASMWEGTWSGEGVSARISRLVYTHLDAASVPTIYAAAHFDEMLHFHPDLH